MAPPPRSRVPAAGSVDPRKPASLRRGSSRWMSRPRRRTEKGRGRSAPLYRTAHPRTTLAWRRPMPILLQPPTILTTDQARPPRRSPSTYEGSSPSPMLRRALGSDAGCGRGRPGRADGLLRLCRRLQPTGVTGDLAATEWRPDAESPKAKRRWAMSERGPRCHGNLTCDGAVRPSFVAATVQISWPSASRFRGRGCPDLAVP